MVAVVICLNACGFSLRGSHSTLTSKYDELKVDCRDKRDWELCHYLRSQITATGTTITESAAFELDVGSVSSKQRAITLDPDATANERELTHHLTYRLIDRKKDVVLLERTLSQSQVYRNNASALVAKDREQEELRQSINQYLVDTMIRELASSNR